nr:MAG TPA: Putative beta-lactamase-like family [Caudoviricetes sp.]
MLMRIINSGSDGNCTILKDGNENELMLDCGLPYETIASNCDLRKLTAVMLSHCH